MVIEIKDLGDYIRLPFTLLGKFFSFVLENFIAISCFAIVIWVLWFFRWNIWEFMLALTQKDSVPEKEVQPESSQSQSKGGTTNV